MPFKLSKTTPASFPSSRSVLFNGTNQYLTVGAASNWTFLNNGSSFTVECWFNVPSVSLSNQYTPISTNAASANIGMTLGLNNVTGGDVIFTIYKGVSGQFPLNVIGNSGSFTPNTWNHVAAVYNSSTSTGTIYMNGVAVASSGSVSAFSTSAPTYTLAIGRYQYSAPGGYLNGYISNLRIANSVLYTSSFTVPTSPLTAVANTSLLTCNAATIVDSSTNNFTITNNNSATVSSVVPFNVVSYGYKFNNRNNPTSGLTGTQKAIFGYGSTGTNTAITNLVSNTGVVATDTAGVGTARYALAAAGYGTDKVLFGYGTNLATSFSMTNKVSNIGVVSEDTTGVGTSRSWLAAAGYGTDKAIFGYGTTTANGSSTGRISMTNLVSNAGVVSTDTTGVGTTRCYLAAAGYGTDKAIFGYGYGTTPTYVSMTNLVSNTGVVATDTTGVGTARSYLAAAGYGSDKAIFGYGYTPSNVSMTNLVSNTGVVASDTTGVGTARTYLAAAGYGTDKAIFGYGYTSVAVSMTNLVSNTGVVATDTTGVGTARYGLASAGFSTAGPAPSGLKFKKVFADPIIVYLTQKAIFGYGSTGAVTAITNLVSNTGVVANDTTGVGTARNYLAAAGYGTDKAIFGYGMEATVTAITNLVSNTGVVATDTTGVGTARRGLAAACYGTGKAIFGYGWVSGAGGGVRSMTNLVSNTGVVATDTTGVGTARTFLAAAGYGTDKAIFGYGDDSGGTYYSITNIVSNTGVVATDTTGVGTARNGSAAAGYGTDKAIFGYGYTGTRVSITNKVNNTGVVASDTTGVGTSRNQLAAAGYGTDKAIFGYGTTGAVTAITNLLSNTGVVATDTTGVGTARFGLAAAGYSLT
jgi:hypothetical protein